MAFVEAEVRRTAECFSDPRLVEEKLMAILGPASANPIINSFTATKADYEFELKVNSASNNRSAIQTTIKVCGLARPDSNILKTLEGVVSQRIPSEIALSRRISLRPRERIQAAIQSSFKSFGLQVNELEMRLVKE